MASTTCIDCGIVFGMPDVKWHRLGISGDTFWCPNGHGMVRNKFKARDVQMEAVTKERDNLLLANMSYRRELKDCTHADKEVKRLKGIIKKMELSTRQGDRSKWALKALGTLED